MSRSLLLASLLLFATASHAQTSRPGSEPDVEPERLSVGFLALDGVYNSELIAPYDIFHHVQFHTEPGMTVFTVGRTMNPVRTFEGLRIAVDHDLDSAPPIDVLVVPSAEHNLDTDLEDKRLIEWVAERGAAARYVVSLCDGAFVLAQAGLLDGWRCTTFPGDIPAFRTRFPQLDVVDGVSLVADGHALTGAGGARSYDPAMYLVEHLYGPAVARGVARGMVIDWHPEAIRRYDTIDRVRGGDVPSGLLPGAQVGHEVTVERADGSKVALRELVPDGASAVVLCILAGGELNDSKLRGGFWCEDTFSEIANLRYLHMRFKESHGADVAFIGVLCPPIHHDTRFGFDAGAFSRPADDPVYERNRRAFVASCLTLQQRDQLPFDAIAFDPRMNLLSPGTRAGDAETEWHGLLKWNEDDQMYGTPTTWVLTGDLTALGPPFWKNVYESPGRAIRYSPRDVAKMIERTLAANPAAQPE